MWIIVADNREFANRYIEIFIPQDEDGQPLTFETFGDAKKWFVDSDLSDTCSARYINMDE